MRVSQFTVLAAATASFVAAAPAPADYGNYGSYGDYQDYPQPSTTSTSTTPSAAPTGYGNYGSYGSYKREAAPEPAPEDYGNYDSYGSYQNYPVVSTSTTTTTTSSSTSTSPAQTGTVALGGQCSSSADCAGGANCYAVNSMLITRCGNFQASCSSDAQCAFNTCNNGLCNGFKPSTTTSATPSATPTESTGYGSYGQYGSYKREAEAEAAA
ncbi:hypothetical protein BDZ45DRAFT_683811 [Acephala macrosclerotiorum]|nr:hypothetical protein BDZ45DRAFT_683811 [Acephala macrosclerotiorum]